jgi:deazaflavin-dependent oxidoreductase (nitroreductase family)
MPTPSELRAINHAVIEEFRANNGQVTSERLKDVPLVLLTTIGARTGRPHTVPLAYFADGPGRIVLWASALAAPAHPAWYHNLVANPQVTIELSPRPHVVECVSGTASTATGAERDRLFGILSSTRPEIAAHQDGAGREIPLVVIGYQQ